MLHGASVIQDALTATRSILGSFACTAERVGGDCALSACAASSQNQTQDDGFLVPLYYFVQYLPFISVVLLRVDTRWRSWTWNRHNLLFDEALPYGTYGVLNLDVGLPKSSLALSAYELTSLPQPSSVQSPRPRHRTVPRDKGPPRIPSCPKEHGLRNYLSVCMLVETLPATIHPETIPPWTARRKATDVNQVGGQAFIAYAFSQSSYHPVAVYAN